MCEVAERPASLKWRLSHEVVQGRAGWVWGVDMDEEKLRAQSQLTPLTLGTNPGMASRVTLREERLEGVC